jgi:short-subunit dehydrogenase
MRLLDAVVVVTGASSGFGELTARRFSRGGAAVVLAARRVDRLEAIAADLERAGGSAIAVACDVARWDDIHRLRDVVAARFGRCDVLVNNAGIPGGGPFADVSEEEADRVMTVNALGVMRCTKAFLPMMLDRGRGHVVNVASLAGRFATPGASVYTASKHAVVAFSEALYYELGSSGIVVTAVSPAFARTDRFTGHGPRPLRIDADRVAAAIVGAVRAGAGPELAIPAWVAPFEALRILVPPLYRWGVRRATARYRPVPARG